MGLFRKDTESDAHRQIELINAEMRAISSALHAHGGDVCYQNKNEIILHINKAEMYAEKYERIKRNLQAYEVGMLKGCNVSVWNGETTAVVVWEMYYRDTIAAMKFAVQNS